jgi:hypothetical protein
LVGALSFILAFPVIGFCGVFSGTFCLPRSSWRFGSIVLLALGLAFYAQMLLRIDFARGENNSFPFVWLLPLAAGGYGAVYFFRRQPPNTSLQPTAAAPSASGEPGNPKAGDESASSSGGCG